MYAIGTPLLRRRTPHHLRRNESGSTLMTVVIFSTTMLIAFLTLLRMAGQEAGLAIREVRRSQALLLAEGGLERAVSWLQAQNEPPEILTEFRPFGLGPDSLSCGLYDVAIVPAPDNFGSTLKNYTIVAAGTSGEQFRELEVDVITQSWANFFYYTGEEISAGSGNPIWFITGDYLGGPTHSNAQMHICGDPIFGGRLTSGAPTFMYYNGDSYNHIESTAASNPPHDMPTFEAGYELGVEQLEHPQHLDDYIAMAQNGGLYLDGDYIIRFARNDQGPMMHGYISYCKGNKWDKKKAVDVLLSDFNGAVYIAGEAHVSGIVDGVVTVATAEDMFIEDDIMYRDSDGIYPAPGCDDLLGLISEGNITVADSPANQHDCVIHGHIIALGESFRVEDHNEGDPRGILTVYGGLVQKRRGAVGQFRNNGGQIQRTHGFGKDYHYDERFKTEQPPGYYQTGNYVKLAWREVVDG